MGLEETKNMTLSNFKQRAPKVKISNAFINFLFNFFSPFRLQYCGYFLTKACRMDITAKITKLHQISVENHTVGNKKSKHFYYFHSFFVVVYKLLLSSKERLFSILCHLEGSVSCSSSVLPIEDRRVIGSLLLLLSAFSPYLP